MIYRHHYSRNYPRGSKGPLPLVLSSGGNTGSRLTVFASRETGQGRGLGSFEASGGWSSTLTSTVAESAKAEFVFNGFYLFNMHEIVGGRIHKRNFAQAEKSGIFTRRYLVHLLNSGKNAYEAT